MNFKFKIDGISVNTQHGSTPVDVDITGIEIEVTDVALREIPQVVTAFKDLILETEASSFQRETMREENEFKREVEREDRREKKMRVRNIPEALTARVMAVQVPVSDRF